jgi:hypothetical protein
MTSVNTEIRSNAKGIAMKLEVVVLPVSNVDRSTEFYTRLGRRQDVTRDRVSRRLRISENRSKYADG